MLVQNTVAVIVLTLLTPPALRPEKTDSGEALHGEWEIVDMIFHTKVQDFGGQPGGWYFFERDGFLRITDTDTRDKVRRDERFKRFMMNPCVIRHRGIDFNDSDPSDRANLISKALYELRDGELRIAYREDWGNRPLSFVEALHDPKVTLIVLKKVAK